MAAKAVWNVMQSFWCKPVHLRFKAIVFKCIVASTLFSGLTAQVLSPHDYNDFDSFISTKIVTLCAGKATIKTTHEDVHAYYRRLPSIQLRHNVGLADSLTELTIQRLRMWQMCSGSRCIIN